MHVYIYTHIHIQVARVCPGSYNKPERVFEAGEEEEDSCWERNAIARPHSSASGVATPYDVCTRAPQEASGGPTWIPEDATGGPRI
eukprot:4970603-Pyramimonas_sp.AAC.1